MLGHAILFLKLLCFRIADCRNCKSTIYSIGLVGQLINIGNYENIYTISDYNLDLLFLRKKLTCYKRVPMNNALLRNLNVRKTSKLHPIKPGFFFANPSLSIKHEKFPTS